MLPGASTSGNVTLQTWEVTPDDVEMIGDVNPDMMGRSIFLNMDSLDEEDVLMRDYDLHIVLFWHFRNFFLKNEKFKGKRFLFLYYGFRSSYCNRN